MVAFELAHAFATRDILSFEEGRCSRMHLNCSTFAWVRDKDQWAGVGLKFVYVKGGVPPSWASYLFHVKMTLLNAPGSWATLGQKLRSLLQNEDKDIIFSAIVGNFDKFCSFFTIG